MFDHPDIQIHAFEDIPLNQDLSLMGEKWMAEYESALIRSVSGEDVPVYEVGYHSAASARSIAANLIELSWYPNYHTRFHEVSISLPRSAFKMCVESASYDCKPVIFVCDDWLNRLHLRSYSVFALIDAIDVKKALADGSLTHAKLAELRDRVDDIAAGHPDVAFISFADNLILKSNYSIGQYDSTIKYTYEPEAILRLLPHIRTAYQAVLGLDIYTAVTQGNNEYYDDDLLHISGAKNHVSLNSLGLPFAQLLAIDSAARAAIKSRTHGKAGAYLDAAFYHSLRFKHSFSKNDEPKFSYHAPMTTGPSYYFPVSFDLLADNLEPPKSP